MSPLPVYGKRPCVLLTNDDGPPSASSPNIFTFCKLLQHRLGWEVKVVIPDCQKSWVGKAYAISDIITASYFYPREPDGLTGDVTTASRPLKAGEAMEWMILSGTPASCSNIALHNLYPGIIDLVISGPNHGRNSSTAFALSSGTLGAALAAALSLPLPGHSSSPSLHLDHIPSIAVSYGVVNRPVPPRAIDLANDAAVDVCARLWEDWGYESGGSKRVQLYSVNVPLVEKALEKKTRRVYWTSMWRNAYGQLFKTTKLDPALNWWSNTQATRPNQPSNSQSFTSALQSSLATIAEDPKDNSSNIKYDEEQQPDQTFPRTKSTYNPADDPTQTPSQAQSTKPVPPRISTTASAGPGALPTPNPSSPAEVEPTNQLRFHFAPNIAPLLNPPMEELPEGSDAWAFAKGYVSVTPLRAGYAEVAEGAQPFANDQAGQWAGKAWT